MILRDIYGLYDLGSNILNQIDFNTQKSHHKSRTFYSYIHIPHSHQLALH